MPGPLMHKACMKHAAKLLAQYGVNIEVGSAWDNVGPDRWNRGHGYNFDASPQQGSILDEISIWNNRLVRDGLWDTSIRILCHYVADALSIGQISAELWGKYDNRIDARMEFVFPKRVKITDQREQINHKHVIDNELRDLMRLVYLRYKDKAKSVRWLFSRDIRDYARFIIQHSGEITAQYVLSAMKMP